MNEIKSALCISIGFVGSSIANLCGGWTGDMATLGIFMAIDFLMGLALAIIFKKSNKAKNGALNSNACWKGLCKKCVTIGFIIVAYRLDLVLGTDYIRTTCIIAFIVNENISIMEKAGLMGFDYPDAIKKAIDILKSKSEGDSK